MRIEVNFLISDISEVLVGLMRHERSFGELTADPVDIPLLTVQAKSCLLASCHFKV